jgi:hypothetical protein
MRVQSLLLMTSVLTLAACASAPSNFETAYSAHASRYTEDLAAANRDYESGRITEADMAARIHAAGETLTAADAATARDEHRALAATAQPAAPSQVAATPIGPAISSPAPATEEHDSCFLIPCGPAEPPAPVSPANASATEPAPPTPSPSPPPDDHNSCLLIRCD